MMKSKLVSSALSLAILCSTSIANAETVVGQLVAKPSAVINADAAPFEVGSETTAYIEGDSVTTGSEASATISLTSGMARIVVAPNTIMSVVDADTASLSLVKGAISVSAQADQSVVVTTTVDSYELVSESAVDAVVAFENDELSVLPKSGSLVVTSQNGAAVTTVDAGNVFVSNGGQAKSVDVNTGTLGTTGALNTVLIVGGVVVGTAAISEAVSDGDEADDGSESE